MISPRHPQKLAPPMCFQTMVACLRTTTDSEQRPPRVHSVFIKVMKGKINRLNIFISGHTTNFGLHKVKHSFGVFAQGLRVSGWPQAANQSLKAHWRRQLLRTPRGDVVGLDAEGDKFVANS